MLQLIRHLPADCSTFADGKPVWTLETHLLDDLRMEIHALRLQFAKAKRPTKPHPLRPKPGKRTVNPRAIKAGQQRRAERQRRLAQT